MDLSRFRNINIDLDELRNLDFNNIGTAPLWVKGFLLVILFCAIIGAGYYFDTSAQLERIKQLQAQEKTLRIQFIGKARRAAHLAAYEKQLAEMRHSFGKMLQQLPNKTEIPGLLLDISQTAISSGLTLEVFQPEPEKKEGFYAIKPIKIKAQGTFQEIFRFVRDVALLPRIVTLDDISLRPVGKNSNQLMLDVTARTYRYLPNQGRNGR